jgi:hypothetical protein
MTNHNATTSTFLTHATRWSPWGENGLPDQLEGRVRATKTFSETALAQFMELADQLTTELEARAPQGAVDRFLAAGSSFEDRLDRWGTLRALERISQLPGRALDFPGWVPDDPNLRRRPFTKIETGLIRLCSLKSPIRAASTGALDAGTASGELALLLPDHVVRANSGTATHLVLLGTERPSTYGYPVATPRTLEIPTWARTAFDQLLIGAENDRPLLYTGNSVDTHKVQSSILMTINKVIDDAGLAGDPTVKPQSIRNSSARRAYESEGIEAAAALLGISDFNSVAREIGIRAHLAPRSR